MVLPLAIEFTYQYIETPSVGVFQNLLASQRTLLRFGCIHTPGYHRSRDHMNQLGRLRDGQQRLLNTPIYSGSIANHNEEPQCILLEGKKVREIAIDCGHLGMGKFTHVIRGFPPMLLQFPRIGLVSEQEAI